MPRYYCDYCDTYLTHDSPSVRKQHNAGYKHKANVRSYYQQFEEQQTQSLIDQRVKEHLGQAAYQVGATYHQHLASFQPNPQRPHLPLLPTPILPIPGAPHAPVSAIRPPVLPRPPPGTLGYGAVPTMPLVAPPGANSLPMQMNGPPRASTLVPPATGGIAAPTSNGGVPMMNPAVYQANPSTSGGFDAFNVSSALGFQRSAPSGPTAPSAATASPDGFTYSQTSETNY